MAETHSIPASQAPVVPQPDARTFRGAAVLSRNLDTYGALGLALFCLATSKWGSYLIPGPPYISDLIIGGLIANRLLLLAAHRQNGAAGARESTMVIAASLLLSWSVLRLAAGGLSIDALRDAAPFMYCIVAFLVVPLSDDQERFTARAITAVLGFQLVWATLSAAGGGQIPFMPEISWAPNQNESFLPLTLFGARPDFDVAVLGMFAAISLHRALSGRRALPNLIVAFWALSVIGLGSSTTAGFLAVVAQMGVVVVLAPARKRLRPSLNRPATTVRDQNRRLALILLLLAVPVGLFALQKTAVVREAALTTGLASPKTFENVGASISTADARRASWERTIEVLGKKPDTVAVGVGFGPNYLVNTGANRLLLNLTDVNVRSPHNFWLNVWARTGLIGLAIMLSVLAAGLWLSLLAIRANRVRDTDVLAVLVMVSLPVTASVGVVFESPFGVIPWFWALGYLSIRAVQTDMARPFWGGRSTGAQSDKRPHPAMTSR